MSIEVTTVTDPKTWNRLVDRADYTDAMHQWEALSVLADHADSTVHRLVGRKGQEPVGVFPVFERQIGPVTAAFSPPPSLRIVYLGPGLLNMDKLSQRKTERRQRRFLDGVFEWLADAVDPDYFHGRTGPGYPDVRPFTWADCTVSPTYTYQVDITAPESELLDRFSRDARSNVRDAEDIDYDFGERGPDAIDRVLEQVRARYESQGITFGVTREFVRDLYEQTHEGTVRPYTCRIDGEFVGGILTFATGDRIARWQGGVKPAEDRDLAVNDVLDWEVMRAGRELGCNTYDLVGADSARISQYKSKFDPELVPFYDVERANWLGSVAARVYKARK